MTNYIVKTHRKGIVYAKPHLFILNKGLNSGKPQKEPFTNSFVIIFSNEEDCETVYWIAFSLWKSKFWHRFLRGSVIPFVSLFEFKKEFFPKVTFFIQDHEQHKKNIKALKLLEMKEKQFQESIMLIKEFRNVILYRYYAK